MDSQRQPLLRKRTSPGSVLARRFLSVAVTAVCLVAWNPEAEAISFLTYLGAVLKTQLDSKRGKLTRRQENDIFFSLWRQYRQEQTALSFVGQGGLGNQFPVAGLDRGSTALLSFQFIDPATGLPTVGPQVGSVSYEANFDPETPDVFIALGVSTDAATNFGLPFTVAGFEPLVRAIPLTPSGDPIVVAGVDGNNVAVGFVVDLPNSIPEPRIGLLVVLGFAFAVAFRRTHSAATGGTADSYGELRR